MSPSKALLITCPESKSDAMSRPPALVIRVAVSIESSIEREKRDSFQTMIPSDSPLSTFSTKLAILGPLAAGDVHLLDLAEPLYERFCAALESSGVPVLRGVFGARMEVSLLNDGPVTVILET